MGENNNAVNAETGFSPRGMLNQFVPGEMLGGKYKVLSLLGQGGMGTVYRVEQVFLNKEMALKTLNSVSASDLTLQRFQIEAKAASALRHPNLVEVHDFGLLSDGRPYLVMDFIEGISLADYLKERGLLGVDDVTPIFAQACFGLLAAHERGIVHRDIKPGNIMLLKNRSFESEGSVKVVDFGIAKLTGREADEVQALTRTGEIFGSPLYMSPEQCAGGVVDQRSDIYSLGCVLFEMLTGTPPHVGQNALLTMKLHESHHAPSLKEASLGKQFPEALEQVAAKMLRKLPGQRYQNIGLVAHDLASACKGRAVSDLRPAKVTQPAKIISMKLSQFVLITSSLAVITTALSGFCGYQYKQFELESVQGASTNAVQLGTINFDSGWSTRDRFEELDRQSISTIFV
jgi:serine/threonine protein kinase